ncbi:MAG: endonuclease III [Deltaproteobacteria bacterium]|nr:endonuclease III [Deltaproteobacteria bacterium]
MDTAAIVTVIDRIRIFAKDLEVPIVTELARIHADPFEILISTILSLRTKEEVTAEATKRLFCLASTPEEMVLLPETAISEAIYPVGFYRTKARTIVSLSRELIDRYGSIVPSDLDELLKLRGVGRKTANLVVSLGYGGDGLCVDTHVHRISNRLGCVTTKRPDETEAVLREKLPKKHWREINTLFVTFGRIICRPLSPLCSSCPVADLCERRTVTRSR